MKRLKLFSILFGTLLFCFCFASAQEPTCEGVDTIHWKRINTIPIDFGSKCIDVDYRKSYSIKPNIKIFTHLKRKKKSGCNEYQSIDFKKYNIITFYSTVGSCKQPFVNYTLFNTGTKVPFLKITITQFGYCKNAVGVGFDCLVLKKLCSKDLKVCITRKIIEDKRFLEK
jgi:hypothetical protein